MKGKLIVLYGINNLGKTTQADLLVKNLRRAGRDAKYVKYPIYSLEPTGSRINKYLRAGNPENLTAEEAQILYAENRRQYEPTLRADLENGIDVVAEDYWGTGVAWGVGAGLNKEFLLRLNAGILQEDAAFLIQGKRFTTGIEENHKHEQDAGLVERVDKAHRDLAKQFNLKIIDGNRPVHVISKQIWEEVEKRFSIIIV